MEPAVVGDSPVGQQQVRLKLHFADATILSAQQIHEGLSDSWFFLGRHLHSIADLASHIVVAFGLRSSCPHGISLRMENFTLPPSQPVVLLKDKDIISINRKGGPLGVTHRQGELAYSSSFGTFEKISPLGVKTRAIEEFEWETGGYESEKEEEKDIRKNLLKDSKHKALKPGIMKKRGREKLEWKSVPSNAAHYQVKHADSPLKNPEEDVNDKVLKKSTAKSREKKRKWEKIERIEGQGLEVVPYMANVDDKKDKRKKVKKERLEDQQVESKKLQGTTKRQECQISSEGQTTYFSKATRIEEEKKDNAILNTGGDQIKNHTAEKQTMDFGSKKNMPFSMSSSDQEVKHKEKTPGLHLNNEIVKRCSRSTLRKKAKRRWKQENPEFPTKTSRQIDDPVKIDKTGTEQVCLFAPTKHEDDGDAEEERLPRVVRPGHIRFQHTDEDDDQSQQKSLPCLRWSNGISKRKGQSWGQEKTKRSNNNFEAMSDMELDDIQEFEPETLPAVEGALQNGDVIAYRVLELTSSYCPEVSEYRVGRVLDLESQSGKLKLADVPKYRTKRCNDQNPPFYEDGVLETEISSLGEVRLVERSKLESTVQASRENDIKGDVDIATASTMDASKTCNATLNSTEADQLIEKSDSAPFEAWPEISDAFQRKRDELAMQLHSTAVGVANHGNDQELENECRPESQSLEVTVATKIADHKNNEELENTKEITTTQNSELEKPKLESSSSAGKRGSAARARGWHRKAGGLGSTMALLRSQNLTI